MPVKGISPLVATVVIVVLTLGLAALVSGSFTSLLKGQTETASKSDQCPTNILELVDKRCDMQVNYSIIRATITNVGNFPLSNFTIFADINGKIYTNSTPDNGISVLNPGSTITLSAAHNTSSFTTNFTGPIARLRIIIGAACPGIYAEVTNDTKSIGTC